MRFLTDQDVYQSTVESLKALGHEVITARDLGLAQAKDPEILARAHMEQCILVTRDKGP